MGGGGTNWELALVLERSSLGCCFPLGETGAGSGVMDEKNLASCWEDGILLDSALLESEVVILLEFCLTSMVAVVKDELASKVVPRTNGVVGGDDDGVRLKLTFSDFSVNCIDCLV